LRKAFRDLYRGPEKAYASMDFTGKGKIEENAFLDSLAVQRLGFDKNDVIEFFKQHNIF